ncbi:MAG: 3-hydroxyacyl-ACP dehydratase FabZ family protein [Phycisphaeraceae bacterium]
MWIDRIVELEKGSRCVAVKNVSLAEEHLHDHFAATDDYPATPVMPAPLIIEGMAQTAGIMVGHARDFAEKVILAKIGKARFDRDVYPGHTLRYTATMDRIDDSGASTTGLVELIDNAVDNPEPVAIGEIELMFSHIDQNRRGLDFPEHNFVFTDQFMDLMRNSGFAQPTS